MLLNHCSAGEISQKPTTNRKGCSVLAKCKTMLLMGGFLFDQTNVVRRLHEIEKKSKNTVKMMDMVASLLDVVVSEEVDHVVE